MFHNLMKCHNLMTNPIWVPAGGIFSHQDPNWSGPELAVPPSLGFATLLIWFVCTSTFCELGHFLAWWVPSPAEPASPSSWRGLEGSCFGRRLLGLSSSNNMSGWRFTPLEHLKIGFIYLFLAVLSLWLRGLSLLVVSGGCSRCGPQALECVSFSSCSSWAWCSGACGNLPGPRIETMSPALVGGFLSTGPPGKWSLEHFLEHLWLSLLCSSVWSNLWVTSLLDLLSQNPYF